MLNINAIKQAFSIHNLSARHKVGLTALFLAVWLGTGLFFGSQPLEAAKETGSNISWKQTVEPQLLVTICTRADDVSNEAELISAINFINSQTVPCAYRFFLDNDILLTASPPVLDNSIAGIEFIIRGEGFTVDGQDIVGVRPFDIAADTLVTFKDITITGGNVSTGSGGGINAVDGAEVTIQRSTIEGNVASEGGGINVEEGVLKLNESTVYDNTSSTFGGGIHIENSTTMTMTQSTVSNNVSGTWGGGIANNGSMMNISDTTISSNETEFGGGGIYNTLFMTLLSSTVSDNSANNAGITGGSGAGIYNGWTATISNSTISGNTAAGVGSALFNDGDATVSNSTISDNTDNGTGGSVYAATTSTATFNNSILANATSGDVCVEGSPSGNIVADAVNLDDDGSCDFATLSTSINLGPLQDNGGPTFTHALLIGSDAVNAALADPEITKDQRGVPRPQGSDPDVGAFERRLIVYISSSAAGTIGGVNFVDEDILAYDPDTNTWSRYFDGSDVGLNADPLKDVDAFTLLDDGSILLSIAGDATIPDVGAIDDSDIVRFVPTQTGNNTIGTFEMYFDGSDVNLDTNGEDVDAISVLEDGRIIISTIGAASTFKQFGGTLNSLDEDLIVFTPTSLGTITDGYFELYTDGTDFGLNLPGEDLWGVSVLGDDLYINPQSDFDTGTIAGIAADFFVCADVIVGSAASCGLQAIVFDGAAEGIEGKRLDGIHVNFD
ncbi:MAG: right-handed parallel beta-helix repeat-containing protein [Chloroflexota bacterium]